MKRKFFAFTLAFLLLAMSFPFSVLADSNNGLIFEKSSDGTYYSVVGHERGITSFVIPAEYNGLPVKEIGENAFEFCVTLETITLPSSITEIKANAFYGCKKLKNINIPNSVTKIDVGAFSACSSLSEIDIPSSVTFIGESAFYNSGLEKIELPNSITKIRTSTFGACSKLSTVIIPPSVNEIESNAFEYSQSINEIVIPITVEWMGKNVFFRCENLNTIRCEAESKPDGWKHEWNYMCNAEVVWGFFNPDAPTPICGDVDNDGEITADDYIILKRIYFGQAKTDSLADSENALYRCDVNKNRKIDADDYISLKRAYFGTYKI